MWKIGPSTSASLRQFWAPARRAGSNHTTVLEGLRRDGLDLVHTTLVRSYCFDVLRSPGVSGPCLTQNLIILFGVASVHGIKYGAFPRDRPLLFLPSCSCSAKLGGCATFRDPSAAVAQCILQSSLATREIFVRRSPSGRLLSHTFVLSFRARLAIHKDAVPG